MNSEIIEVKAVVSKELFYRDMFGVYSFTPIRTSEKVNVNEDYNTFVVTGTCPQLIKGKTYDFSIVPSKHKKYGDGYSFVEIKARKLITIEEQQEYLRQVVSNKDANAIIAAYPNEMIVDIIKAGKVDVNNVKGVKEKKLKQVLGKLTMYENLQVALIELKDLQISMNSLRNLVDHFGSQDVLIDKIKENIYILTEVDMFSFKRIDEYAMKRGDDPESVYRIKSCFEHIVKENANDGHSWINVESLITKAENLLDIPTVKILNVINQIKENPKRFYFDGELFSLKKFYQYESEIKRHLDRLMNTYQQKGGKDVEELIAEIEESLGVTFTDEQRDAIRISKQNGVFVLNGKAGSGKTFTLQGIIKAHPKDNYMTCALSGKAARILDSKGLKSSTIHRMLGVGGNGQFQFNEEDKLPYDIIVVDESSMANAQLFYSILQAIPDGGKIIIVGDNAQLASIGVGAVFDDLLSTGHYPSKELTKVHRQAQKSGILMEANKVREGQQINERYNFDSKTYGELNDFVLIPRKDRENIFGDIIEISKGFLNKYGQSWFHEYQILTALKQRGENSVKNLNIELQKVFNDVEKDSIERGGYHFREDDKVIHSGNNYSAIVVPDMKTYDDIECDISGLDEETMIEMGIAQKSVFNGTIGKIIRINFEKKETLIEFEDVEGFVVYDVPMLSMIELAYAITIHRSQGMGVKNILATFDFVAYKMLSKQLVYTAMTRASEKLVLICENAALHMAIETDQGSTRNTFLKKLIMEGQVVDE